MGIMELYKENTYREGYVSMLKSSISPESDASLFFFIFYTMVN
jgi:hypothetical protein